MVMFIMMMLAGDTERRMSLVRELYPKLPLSLLKARCAYVLVSPAWCIDSTHLAPSYTHAHLLLL